jgi:altronate dehydratase large subunit
VIDAIVADEHDNVATAIRDLDPGTVTTTQGPAQLNASLRTGHKLSLVDIDSGAHIIKYGEIVGVATSPIRAGDHVHVHNVGDLLGTTRKVGTAARASLPVLEPRPPRLGSWDTNELRAATFDGYRRPQGRPGIRNHLLVLATVGCSTMVAERIAALTGAAVITHNQGCLQLGHDLALTRKQLVGAASNPNVGAVLLVGLGCETIQAAQLMEEIVGKPTAALTIQEAGGTKATVERGSAMARELQRDLEQAQREPFPLSELVVATKCGGSDGLSGLTANPATGVACDMLVDAGAAVVLSETPGLFGSEPHLAARMSRPEDRERLSTALDGVWEEAVRLGELMSEGEMSPGNIDGGLTTLVEKSLGATTKAGTRPFQGFIEMAGAIPGPGLWLMDTPGFDIITISAQAAGGAQMILFTTGRGSPVGCAIAPVVKICSNSKTYGWMEDDMDVNAGAIVTEGLSIDAVGREIFERIRDTASGKQTAAETEGHGEFALARLGSTL